MSHRNSAARAHARGFTLLEVLVALAILGIALGALIKGGADNAANAGYLRDKTLADWVAMNKIAEVRLEGVWLDPGTSHGVVELADREWEWTLTVATTFDADVRRLEVAVAQADGKGSKLVQQVAFLGRPMKRSQVQGPGAAGGGT